MPECRRITIPARKRARGRGRGRAGITPAAPSTTPAVLSVPSSVFAVMNPLLFPRKPTRRFRKPFNARARSRTLLPDRVAGWRKLSG